MKYLFVHQNFPGQFIHLARHLAAQKNNQVVALSIYKQAVPKGVQLRCYQMLRKSVPETHPLLADMEAKVMRGEACAAAALQLKREGFVPDIIIGHPGWGETLFLKEAFPQAKLVLYCEYFYALQGQDVGFDPEMPRLTFERQCHLRMKNTTNLHSLHMADAAISPTAWQKSTYPHWAQDKIFQIHDGINLSQLQPNPKATIKLGSADGKHVKYTFKPGAEVLTYVARNLEAVRGFHVLMRSLPAILRARPQAHVIMVGGEDVSYGSKAPGNLSWKEYMLKEVEAELDMERVHFVGKVPYATYLELLQISRLHIYLTTPFVLSWSFLEAALAGTPILASNTQPVMEFAAELGVDTVDFFDVQGIADYAIEKLATPSKPRQPRRLQRVELEYCLQQQLQFLRNL